MRSHSDCRPIFTLVGIPVLFWVIRQCFWLIVSAMISAEVDRGTEGAERVSFFFDTLGSAMRIDQVVGRWSDDSSPAEPLIMLAFATGGARTNIGANHLRAFFDVTYSEAELLAALCAGTDVAGFTRLRKVSIHTARSQLKRLMVKTAARCQFDLIRMA
jgi:hypothetical protein